MTDDGGVWLGMRRRTGKRKIDSGALTVTPILYWIGYFQERQTRAGRRAGVVTNRDQT